MVNTEGTKLTKQELNRYSRHLVLPEMGIKGQEGLKKGKVLITEQ